MNIIGKVIPDGDDNYVLEAEIGPGFVDKVELSEFLEEFEGTEVRITITKFERRQYSKDDKFTEGGLLDGSK